MSRGWISDDASMTNMQHYVVVQNSLDVAFEGEHTILACKEKISPFLFVALFVKKNVNYCALYDIKFCQIAPILLKARIHI